MAEFKESAEESVKEIITDQYAKVDGKFENRPCHSRQKNFNQKRIEQDKRISSFTGTYDEHLDNMITNNKVIKKFEMKKIIWNENQNEYG